ncbi:MAG: hypothetical protein A2806_02460 [Candidatus Terrybacteria bacterium RIFCSPHIGHO2_01_FULL_48_17]|uniref:SHS2 domain-containing protein n=1 Tax=Candidatus Terrybacteria bacterium RIFCSPHIGHO2_01_FULL_48_17 TaxID=1802362 RepID=A0A1G2PHR8_9BACT|nr:MAG: hypothetical protein A2806_02460 [Candidatus Terrybacteria bacterium RIFCSPHIGHO2_01_FULL_48_17]OHA53603.1 MAG: hypothetical protein A3A30_00415 [Candidatus Terrybacteria bacterium RIFCSPLOWO2_01_FULL_48_14]
MKHIAIGIDINDSALNVVVLAETPEQPLIQLKRHIALQEGLVKNGAVVKEQDLAAIISRELEALSDAKQGTSYTIVGVADNEVFPHLVDVPAQGNVVKWKQEAFRRAFSAVPFGPQELTADLEDLGIEKKGKRALLFVAARKQVIDGLDRAIRHAGLEPQVFEMASVALARALVPEAFQDKKNTVLLNIGLAFANIALFWEGSLRFAESLPLPKNGELSQSTLAMLAEHIERAMQFSGVPFAQLVFTGDLAFEPALRTSLQNNFPRIPLRVGADNKEDMAIATARGLAMRGLEVDPTKRGMNLLPTKQEASPPRVLAPIVFIYRRVLDILGKNK